MESTHTYIFIGTLRGMALRQFGVFSSFFGANFRLIVVASFSCLAPALFVDSILCCCCCGFCCCRRPWPRLTTRQASFDSFASLILVSFLQSPKKKKTGCWPAIKLDAAFSSFSFFVASFSIQLSLFAESRSKFNILLILFVDLRFY